MSEGSDSLHTFVTHPTHQQRLHGEEEIVMGTTSLQYGDRMNQAHIAPEQRRKRQPNPDHPVDQAPGHINGTARSEMPYMQS